MVVINTLQAQWDPMTRSEEFLALAPRERHAETEAFIYEHLPPPSVSSDCEICDARSHDPDGLFHGRWQWIQKEPLQVPSNNYVDYLVEY